MKKFTKSFLAVSLSSTIALQNASFISNAEENNLETDKNSFIANKQLDDDGITQVDPESIPHKSMGAPDGQILPFKIYDPNLDIKTLSNPKAIGYGTITATTLNIRSGPSTSYDSVGTLEEGDNIEILEKNGNWYRISFDKTTAFISASYVKLSPVEKGIDVSKWNGNIDWNLVKNAGIDYVIIRAGYGSSTVDQHFHSHIQGATKAGLKVGVYWFSYATSVAKAEQEAAMCLKTIAPYKDSISYPVFFDYEYASLDYATDKGISITKDLSSQMAEAFLNDVEDAGYINGIYTNKDFGDRYFHSDLLVENNLWVAQYYKTCTYPRPYMMWQYTDQGTINGIGTPSNPKYFDMNYTYLKPSSGYEETKINLSDCVVKDLEDETYTGNEIKPEITVTHNGDKLTLNEDYTVTYNENVSVGKASVTIEGIGGFEGTITKYFNIVEFVPQDIADFNISEKTSNSVTLSWSKLDDIDGYEIYRSDSDDNSYELIKTITDKTTTTFKDSDLNSGTSYKYKIRSYKVIGSKYFYSDYSNICEVDTDIVVLPVIKTGYTTSDLNIRRGPSTNYDIIGDLKSGSAIEIVDVDSETGWYKVKFESRYGYLSNKYVALNTLSDIDAKSGITTTTLNVRTGPSTDYTSIGKLNPESVVEIIGADSKTGWLKIKFESGYGYVSNKYVTLEKKPVNNTNTFTGTTTLPLNVRSGPSTDYASIGKLNSKDTVEIVGVDSETGWYKIKYNGNYAYISNKYVTVKDEIVFSAKTTSSTNVRTGPSVSHSAIGKLQSNTDIEIVATDFKTGWHKFKYNGSYAYVSYKYVTLNK